MVAIFGIDIPIALYCQFVFYDLLVGAAQVKIDFPFVCSYF
jgi:hypothetical protein